MAKKREHLIYRIKHISLRWGLFLAFIILIGIILLSVLLYSLRSSKVHSTYNAEQKSEIYFEKTESELRLLFKSINSELVKSHMFIENGLVDLKELDKTISLFVPSLNNLPSCHSMNISDLHGNNITIFENLDTISGRGTINSKLAVRNYRPNFTENNFSNKSSWYRFDGSFKEIIESWSQELYWSEQDLIKMYPNKSYQYLTKEEKAYNPAKRIWHTGAVQLFKKNNSESTNIEDLIFYTDIDVFFTTKTFGITASIAAKDPSGEIIVVAYDLLLNNFSQFTMGLKPTKDGLVWVFDENGNVLGLPYSDKFLKEKDFDNYCFQSYEKLEIPIVSYVMDQWISADRTDQELKKIKFFNEYYWFKTSSYALKNDKIFWIGVILPDRDLSYFFVEERRLIFLLTIISLIVSIFLVLYISKRISRPLIELKDSALKYNLGETNLKIPFKGTSETVQLSKSIFKMQTDLNRQMIKLQQNEKNYKSLVSNLPGLVYKAKCDNVFELVFVSDKVFEIVNRKAESFLQNKECKWIDFIHPEDKQDYLNMYSEMLLSKSSFEMEYRIICDDGGVKWMHESSKVITEDDFFVEGFIYDVTELKLYIDQIQKYSRVVEQNPSGIIIIRINGNIEYINPKILELTALTYKDLVGNKPDFLKGLTKSGYLYEEIKEKVRSGEEWSGELELTNINGAKFWISLKVFPLRTDKGEITHSIGLVEDITEKVEVKQQLIRAKEQAEESNKLKSHFLSNMSHEIRTPMNGIIGFLGLLKNMNLTEEKRIQYIEIINKSGQRLLDTVNDIIEMSKIESGEINVVKSVFSVNEMLEYLLNFFMPQTQEKNIDLRAKILKTDVVNLFTDKHLLEGVLINLIKNAIKFTSKGFVEFGCENKGNLLSFYVKDSGRGIPAEKLKAVFERFVQADIKHTRGHEGSGLGLAISNSYVKILGGEICAESELDIGSCFYFTIPLVVVNETEKIFESSLNENIDKELNKSNFKVLVAEDDETNFFYIDAMLKNFNAKSLWAKNGKESIEIFKGSNDISMVLMDLKMPVMDGFQACVEIKKLNKNIPIVVQTAFAFPEEKAEAFKAGCDDYLVKPISNEELYKILNKYI